MTVYIITSVILTIISFFAYGVYVESILDDSRFDETERSILNSVRVLGSFNPGVRWAMFRHSVWKISKWMSIFLLSYLICVLNLYFSLALYIYNA